MADNRAKMKKSRRAKSRAQIAYLKRLGAHIRKIRRAKGYSQDRLYLEAGFGGHTMSRIEAGRVDPQISTLKRIADVLNVPVKKLLDFD